MSASTRTVQQQTLGTGQLGAALAVVALAIIVAAAIAFGALNPPKATTSPAVPGVPPDARIQLGSTTNQPSVTSPGVGVPPDARVPGWTTTKPVVTSPFGGLSPDERSLGSDATGAGNNGPRLRPR